MCTSLNKSLTTISLILLLPLLVAAWQYPSAGLVAGGALIALLLISACLAVVEKHRKAYLLHDITYYEFMRNVAGEISVILLSMLCAAFFGNLIALLLTRGIDHTLIRFAVGVFVGLLVGLSLGLMFRRVRKWFFQPAG